MECRDLIVKGLSTLVETAYLSTDHIVDDRPILAAPEVPEHHFFPVVRRRVGLFPRHGDQRHSSQHEDDQ